MTEFSQLGLSATTLKAVADTGYTTATPIQASAIPVALAGRDVLGIAQTGTGKTAAFTLPMIDRLSSGRAKARMPRALVLAPTRELADQVASSFEKYAKGTKLSWALLIGGVSMGDQVTLLNKGVDVLIATPGRLLDLFERGKVLLNDVKLLVIDEADRMLDMGFIPDIEKIVGFLPKIRQTLFFSATMPPEIRRLTETFLINPKQISVAPASKPAAESVTQGLIIVPAAEAKREALRALLRREPVKNALIFCNRKRDVGVLHKSLARHGFNAGSLHGDMHQSVRTETLDKFKAGEITLLVCSDVAARGLDIDDMSHVFNFDVPIHAEDYIHRIGRTGRAGRSGTAYTLATPEDGKFVSAIERLLGREIPRIDVEGHSGGELSADGHRRRRGAAPKDEAPKRAPRPKAEPRPRAAPRSRAPAEAEAEDAPIPLDAAAPIPSAAPVANVTPFRQRPPRRDERGRHEDREDRTPVVGLGDHVPAFLLRTVKAAGSVRG